MRFRWSIGLLLLLGVGVLWYLSQESRGPETGTPSVDAIGDAAGGESIDASRPSPAGASSTLNDGARAKDEDLAGRRSELASLESLDSMGVRGRVVDAAGGGIAGAEVTWTAPTSLDTRWEAGWHGEDWGPLERAELRTHSDAAGDFAFASDLPTEGLLGSVLWATAPGYVAGGFTHGLWEKNPPRIVLEKAGLLRVRVEDSLGNPMPGALVEQYGLTPSSAPVEVGGRLDLQRSRRLLQREARTGQDGTLELGPLPGEQVLRARQGSSISATWRGLGPAQVVLRLEQGFSVGGRIELPDWSFLDYVGERRILIGTREGNLWKGLATLRDVQAGTWGPVLLPRLPGARYFAKLEGSPIIPLTLDFQAPPEPAAGNPQGDQVLQLDFHAELGSQVTLCGLDQNDELVPDITATVWWERDGVRQSITRRAPAGSPYANPWSMPPCDLFYSVEAPGYAPGTGGPISVPELQPTAHPVRLHRAGRLEGKVTYLGQPVEDFTLYVWLNSSHASDQRVAFRGRQDGRFAIDSAPLGEVALSASSGRFPPSRMQLVTIEPDQVAQVSIELEAPSVGLGHVRSLDTKEPIGSAELSVGMLHGGLDYGPFGFPQRVSRNGSFRLENLLPGPNLVRVSARGYAPVFLTTQGKAGQEVDCGTVFLSPATTLELELVSSDPDQDFSQYSALILFPRVLPLTRFPASGRLRCADATPGNYTIQIMQGASEQATIRTAFFPGEPWKLTHRVAQGRRVQGKVVPSALVGLDQVALVSLLYSDSPGVKTLMHREIDAEGGFVFEDVPGPSASVSVLDGKRAFIGQASAAFGALEELTLNPQLGAEPLRIHIKDRAGAALPLAFLSLREVGGSPYFNIGATDQSGTMLGFGVPDRPIEVFVQQRDHGYGMFQHSGVRGDVEYALGNDSSMLLQVFDGAVPLEGARVAVADAQGERMFAYQSSAADGLVRLQGYSQGSYRLLATHPHCWPVLFDAPASPAGPATEVQMRRLGGLNIYVSDALGELIFPERLSLWRVEDGADVQAWIKAGRVEASLNAAGFIGSRGIRGLPHGEYRWSIGEQHGVLLVKPEETRDVSLVLGG